ncbi:hypothetical protein CQW23_31999 [Capsicum baccatum]|uniref:Protein kinase domain-containing protein n=1 Tax=Capsicum baccatum TaxID=33114 RepID=A0A2G2V5Z7_CAPBA|nr:hypothetical protein CQW23_31999 [Capsicum baccatum]
MFINLKGVRWSMLDSTVEVLASWNEGCIHKNINIRNILIDSNIRAKIGNFNLAKETDTSGTTWELVGTTGYMAPEYVEAGSVTSKMDIYAFGVVLLELVTKKDVIVEESGEILLSAAVAENNGRRKCSN